MAVLQEITTTEQDNHSIDRRPSPEGQTETPEDEPNTPEADENSNHPIRNGGFSDAEADSEGAEGAVAIQTAAPVPPPTAMRRRRRCILRGCCCCLTLRQGALLIGGFQVCVIVLHLLMETLYLAGVLLAGSYALNDDLTGNIDGDGVRWGSLDIAYASLSGIILVQELIALLFACLLVHGARTGRRGFVRAWLIFTAFMLAADIGLWAARLTLEFMYLPARGGFLLFRALIGLCLPVYFLLVVRSFYYELVDEDDLAERGAIVTAPLLYKAPPPPYEASPPYLPTNRPPFNGGPPGADGAKRPLETNLDDLDDGFGAPWQHSRPAYAAQRGSMYQDEDEMNQEEAGPLPQKQRPISGAEFHAGPSAWVALRRSQVRSYVDEGDYDEVAAEEETEAELEAARKRASRRIVGAGRMVLPPLPPGARASLQHVPPPITPSPPPSFRQPTLI